MKSSHLPLTVWATSTQTGLTGSILGAVRLCWLVARSAASEVSLSPPIERAYLPSPARYDRLIKRYLPRQKLFHATREVFLRQATTG